MCAGAPNAAPWAESSSDKGGNVSKHRVCREIREPCGAPSHADGVGLGARRMSYGEAAALRGAREGRGWSSAGWHERGESTPVRVPTV